MAEYRDHYAEIQAAGAGVAALSADTPADSERLRRELRLPFSLLCDPDRAAIRAFGVLNAAEFGGIAHPAVFVIGPDLRVHYRSLDRMRNRVRTDGILAFLRSGPAEAASPEGGTVAPGLGEMLRAIRNFAGFLLRRRRT